MKSKLQRTQISLRRFLALVTYLAVLLYFVIPGADSDPFTKPLAWVYDYGREASENPGFLLHTVSGMALLIGTIPAFFVLRWWTVLLAMVCGGLYFAIGRMEAVYA